MVDALWEGSGVGSRGGWQTSLGLPILNVDNFAGEGAEKLKESLSKKMERMR
jgi:hypothetical protein